MLKTHYRINTTSSVFTPDTSMTNATENFEDKYNYSSLPDILR